MEYGGFEGKRNKLDFVGVVSGSKMCLTIYHFDIIGGRSIVCSFVPRGNCAALHSNTNAERRNVCSISQTILIRCPYACVTSPIRSDPK